LLKGKLQQVQVTHAQLLDTANDLALGSVSIDIQHTFLAVIAVDYKY